MKATEFYNNKQVLPDLIKITITELMEQFANQRVIEELEDVLDMIQCSENLDSLREHITSKIELKQEG